MNLKNKINVYLTVFRNTDGIPFGQRNRIMSELADTLGLKHWHSATTDGKMYVFELKRKDRRSPLASVEFSAK